MEKPSLALIPTGYKDGKLYSVLPENGVGDFDVVRGSGATRVNKEGLVESMANNTPRLDYTGGGCPSLLLEPLSTNLITHSEDFSQWIGSGCTVGNSSSVVNPSNSNNIGIITGAVGTTVKFARINVITSLSILTYSAFFKYNSHQWVQIASGGTSEYANFDIQNGVVGNKALNTTSTIDDFGSGWYRCTLSTSVASTPSNMAFALIDTANSSRLEVTSSVGSAYIWGAQLESLPYATSYIPTSGAIASRLADKVTGAGDATTFNSTEGVLYVEAAALETGRITISDGTLTNRITINVSTNDSSISGFVNVNNATQYDFYESVQSVFNYNKIAVKYKENDFSFFINGTKYDVDTSGSTFAANTLTSLSFNNGVSGSNFTGKVKDLRTYNTALTDAELTELTTI